MIYFVLTGITSAIISLEQSSYNVSEGSGFVEVCADLEGLGVEEGDITVNIFTESISATGKPSIINVITIRLYNCVTVDLQLPSVRATIGSGNDADSILLA